MFNKLINKLASSIVRATSTTGKVNATPAQLAQVQTITIPANVGTRRNMVGHSIPSDAAPLNGKFTPEHLELLSSQYLRDAIAGLGAWSALAKMSNAYAKLQSRRNADPTAYEQAKEEFHCWNAATSIDKQMNEEAVIIALDKIAEVPVQKGNEQTDAIIARVLNKSIDEVKTERIAKAAKQTAQRKELLAALCADVWQYSGEDVDCFLSSAKVAAKAVQTIEWIASTWQGEPAQIASELLLIESDIKTIEALARKEEEHERDGVAEVGHSSQADYKHDPLKNQGINPNQDALDSYMAERFAD